MVEKKKWGPAASNHGVEGSRISPVGAWSSNSVSATRHRGVKVARGHTHRTETTRRRLLRCWNAIQNTFF